MNILFIHEIDWLRKVVFELHTLSELLSLKGHQVYAIDYESMWVRDSALDFGGLKTKVVENVTRAYPGASVTLIRPGFFKIPGISRFSAIFTQYREIKRVIKEKTIDVIILYSIPTNGLQTLYFARKLGVPVIFRSIDILHQLVNSSVLAPVTHFLERKIYSNVDLIFTISPRLSRYVAAFGVSEEKVKILPLGVDTETFHPDKENAELRRNWGLDDGPVIVFMGTLFTFSGLDDFIRQFPKVLAEVPETRLLIVGDGPQRPKLERMITEMGLTERIIITGFQPFELMPQYINLATVCINPFHVTDATRDIFPTKIVQYMACGKPVSATPLPGLKAIVDGDQQGILYANSPASMVADVVSLLQSSERRQYMGQAALSYVKQTHSYDIITRQLEAVLSELTARKQVR